MTINKIEDVETILDRLHRDIDYAVNLHAFWCVANEDFDLHRMFNRTVEVNWINAVQRTLFDGVILALMRIHDSPRNDRACLPRLMSLLSDEEVRAVLLQRARGWGLSMPAPEGERVIAMRSEKAKKNVENAQRRIREAMSCMTG